MGLYVCDCCGAVENTVQGSYYLTSVGSDNEDYGIPEGELWCHRCCPTHRPDGSLIKSSTHPYGQYTGRVQPFLWNGRTGVYNRVSKDQYIQSMEMLGSYFDENVIVRKDLTKRDARTAFLTVETYLKQQHLCELLLVENGGETRIGDAGYHKLRTLVAETKDPCGAIKIYSSHRVDLRKTVCK